MKALLVSFEFGEHVLGGLGRVINGLTEQLRQTVDLDVFLIYFDARRLAISAKVYRCDSERYGELVASYSGAHARACVEQIRREGYDIVHFFSVHWIIGDIIERLTRELPEQKIVYSVHSLIKYERGTRKNPRSFFAAEEKLIRAASSLHVLNATSRDYLERAYADEARDKPVHVIPNGVQPADALPRDAVFGRMLSARLLPRATTIVCLSRWAHGKGLEHFVRAAARLLEEGHDVQFVLAGRKLYSWEMHWYVYVAKLSYMAWRLGRRCTVLGWLDSAQRNTLFSFADVVVVPSELEYYPYAVLEPAVAGVPLVCSRLPCVAELLCEGDEYVAFEPCNSGDLAHKLLEVTRQRAGAREMAERARRHVLEVCDWTTIAGDYERLYRETLLGENERQPRRVDASLLPVASASAP